MWLPMLGQPCNRHRSAWQGPSPEPSAQTPAGRTEQTHMKSEESPTRDRDTLALPSQGLKAMRASLRAAEAWMEQLAWTGREELGGAPERGGGLSWLSWTGG